MTIRVVQWTTGGVGRPAVRAVLAHPQLELVGGFAWSAGKAGKDVGGLVGLPPLGITATGDIDEILALRPDVVLYMPLLWDVDHMVRLLEAGVNVVSTANFITGRSYGEADMERLHDAAVRGGVASSDKRGTHGQAPCDVTVRTAACAAGVGVRGARRIAAYVQRLRRRR